MAKIQNIQNEARWYLDLREPPSKEFHPCEIDPIIMGKQQWNVFRRLALNPVESFHFSIHRRESTVVALLSGKIQVTDLQEFSNFQTMLFSQTGLKIVLLDFSQVQAITLDAVPALVQLQKLVRVEKLHLRLCGMNEDLKEKLSRLGVIRSSELSTSLKSAVDSLLTLDSVKAS
jgi:anti-anti-sigma regulatory factor